MDQGNHLEKLGFVEMHLRSRLGRGPNGEAIDQVVRHGQPVRSSVDQQAASAPPCTVAAISDSPKPTFSPKTRFARPIRIRSQPGHGAVDHDLAPAQMDRSLIQQAAGEDLAEHPRTSRHGAEQRQRFDGGWLHKVH